MSSENTSTKSFLFTDIEGSTRLLQAHPQAYPIMVMRQRAIIGDTARAHGGRIVDTEGDGCFAAFPTAADAVRAAVDSQRNLSAETWPEGAFLHVRMGIHTGSVAAVGDGYVGLSVVRASRISSVAHGGQILTSLSTATLLGDELGPSVAVRPLGRYRLKDLLQPEDVFQVEAAGLACEFPPLTTLDSRPHNLPLQATALIGRTAEIACCRTLMEATRLLTLTGPGGSGKTRLALQVAAELLEEFDDGVFFVPLASIADAVHVPGAIEAALSLHTNPERDQVQSLGRYLESLNVLLVIDNFEHVVEAATVISSLLEQARMLKVLVTSREPLHLIEEQEFAVPPMALPDTTDYLPLAWLAGCESLQLFAERARAVDPAFNLSDRNASTIAEICGRLDGLPLAVELAAARMKLFSAQQLLDRLKEPFKVLAGGPRNLPERQQTLRRTIDWSYRMLGPEEKMLFGRLAVFVGGITLESAEAVCASMLLEPLSLDTADGIQSLLDKSLLGKFEDDSDNAPRFRMLETIREYAVELLDQDPQEKLVRNAHASFFADFSVQFHEAIWQEELTRADAVGWIGRVSADYDNIRSAVEWSISAGEVRDAFRIVGSLSVFQSDQGYIRERSEWAGYLAGRGDEVEPLFRARVHRLAAIIAFGSGDEPRAYAEAERALDLARDAGDELLAYNLALEIALRGISDPTRHQEIEAQIQLAADRYREGGSQIGIAFTLNAYGNLYYRQGRYEEALAKYREYLAVSRRGDNHSILVDIGATLWRLGRADEATGIFRQVLMQEREGTLSRMMVSLGLLGLAAVAENPQRAARLLGASDALLRVEQRVRLAGPQEVYDEVRARITVSMDEESFDRLCAEVRSFDTAEAIAYGMEEIGSPVAPNTTGN